MLRSTIVVTLITIFFYTPILNCNAEIDEDTIVGIWLMDEGSGKIVTDKSGNGHDGKIVGNPKWVDGRYGTALEFLGTTDDYVEVLDAPELNITDAITLMGWVNTTSQDCCSDIVGKDDGSDRNYNIHIPSPSGKIFLNGPSGKTTVTATTNVTNGEWHHICGTWDGETAKIFIDGIEEGSAPFAGPIGTSDVPIKIGMRGTGEGMERVFTGAIDEVAVFNVALEEEDINALMESLEKIASVAPNDKLSITWGSIKTNL